MLQLNKTCTTPLSWGLTQSFSNTAHFTSVHAHFTHTLGPCNWLAPAQNSSLCIYSVLRRFLMNNLLNFLLCTEKELLVDIELYIRGLVPLVTYGYNVTSIQLELIDTRVWLHQSKHVEYIQIPLLGYNTRIHHALRNRKLLATKSTLIADIRS